MITVSDTMVDALGNALAGVSVAVETLGGPRAVDGLGLVGSTRVHTTTSNSGVLSMALAPGSYRLSWMTGAEVSQWEFVVPYTGGPYQIRYLGSGAAESRQRQGWRFAGINSALLQFQNATNGNWHSPILTGVDDSIALGWAAAGDEADGPNYREASSCFWLKNASGGTWHAITIEGDDDNPSIAIGDADVAVASNHRIKNGRRQFLNEGTGNYHSLFVSGALGSEATAIGPGEA